MYFLELGFSRWMWEISDESVREHFRSPGPFVLQGAIEGEEDRKLQEPQTAMECARCFLEFFCFCLSVRRATRDRSGPQCGRRWHFVLFHREQNKYWQSRLALFHSANQWEQRRPRRPIVASHPQPPDEQESISPTSANTSRCADTHWMFIVQPWSSLAHTHREHTHPTQARKSRHLTPDSLQQCCFLSKTQLLMIIALMKKKINMRHNGCFGMTQVCWNLLCQGRRLSVRTKTWSSNVLRNKDVLSLYKSNLKVRAKFSLSAWSWTNQSSLLLQKYKCCVKKNFSNQFNKQLILRFHFAWLKIETSFIYLFIYF